MDADRAGPVTMRSKPFARSSAIKAKYVLDADIEKCFDRIDHAAVLKKIKTNPSLRRN